MYIISYNSSFGNVHINKDLVLKIVKDIEKSQFTVFFYTFFAKKQRNV